MRDDAFESRILRFEQAWQQNGPCKIADYLEAPFVHPSPDRGRLLVELICIDLEFRWRNPEIHERALLEEYVERFPELVSFEAMPLELIGEEYRVRCQWGDRPSHSEFLSRFQERQEEIRTTLVSIDDELHEEFVDSRLISRPAAKTSRFEEQADLPFDFPWLSHRDFLLRRLIGSGTMGKVYEAWQQSASRQVAVKFLRKSFLRHPQIIRRFIGEAQIIARLRHPHIVGTQGLGRTSGGSYFFVMDLVTGSNLAQVGRERTITMEEVLRWALDACDALTHAHERGIVHCDLKPANLLLDENGRIRITDFGLARSLTEETPWTAEVEGTAPFMAPEQASRAWGPIDQRTDVYGLGAVLFTLLTGRPPFLGRRLPDILADVIAASPVISPASLRPDLPQPLSDVCRKCLAKSPAERFPTIQDVRTALVTLREAVPG